MLVSFAFAMVALVALLTRQSVLKLVQAPAHSVGVGGRLRPKDQLGPG